MLGQSSFFGREIPEVPIFGRKLAASKGLVDVFGGGPTLSDLLPDGEPNGTGDSDHDGRSDDDEYVDRTQPHR